MTAYNTSTHASTRYPSPLQLIDISDVLVTQSPATSFHDLSFLFSTLLPNSRPTIVLPRHVNPEVGSDEHAEHGVTNRDDVGCAEKVGVQRRAIDEYSGYGSEISDLG